MMYQTLLAPINPQGDVFLAVYFGSHIVGGEETRETAYARFEVRNIHDPAQTRNLAAVCTLPRPASRREQQHKLSMAEGQARLADDPRSAKSLRKHYAANAVAGRHAARLAGADGVWVPRRLLVAGSTALCGFDTGGIHWGEAQGAGVRRVDLGSGQTNFAADAAVSAAAVPELPIAELDQVDETQLEALLGTLLQAATAPAPAGLTPRQISQPLALAADAGLAIFPGSPGPQEVRLQAGLPVTVRWPQPVERVFGTPRGWLMLAQGKAVLYPYGATQPLAEWALPKGGYGWGAELAADGSVLVLPGDNARVLVLQLADGVTRVFHPHRGVARDCFAAVAVAADGTQFASLAGEQLAITRLADGTTQAAGRLPTAVREDAAPDGYVVRSVIAPGMAFVGAELWVADTAGLRHAPPEARMFVSEAGRPGARRPLKIKRTVPLPDTLRQVLGAAAEAVLAHDSPALHLQRKALNQSGWLLPGKTKAPPLGASRLGGWPDLPPATPWPLWQERPMAFLAQINLAEAHAVCADVRLPKTGLLSFFLGCGADTYVPDGQTSERYLVDLMLGTAASDRGGWQVIYSADATHLQRRTWQVAPLPELFAPCAVSFKPGGNRLPGTGSVAYTLLPFTAEQRDDYNDILAQTQSEPTSERHLLLGQPDLIQSTPPEWMCELASRGDDPWLAIDPADPRYVEPATAAARWGLLLQLYSDDAANYLWGDGGHLYFYGPREAMAAGDFSGVWVNFEN